MDKEKKIEELAFKIAELLKEHGCHIDVAIYFSGKRLTTFEGKKPYGEWELQEGYKASNITEYANNDTITMTFEGSFYSVINYGTDRELFRKFNELLQSYGYYYEQGNAWNLALYEL